MRRLFAIPFILFHLALYAQQTPPSVLQGKWLGTLNAGAEIRVVFNFRVMDDSISTTIDIPEQGAIGIPTEKTTFEKGDLLVTIPLIRGQYKAKYDSATHEIQGVWIQGAPLPLALSKVDTVEPLSRPQDPVKPYPYKVEEVVIPGMGNDSISLSGTFTIPEGVGPFPVVVLITGSGPQNRDETLLGHKPFLVLSDHLTRNGIAVLRYDDRGVGKSTGNFADATTSDFADDANAAVKYLQSRTDIPLGMIGLAGHSEGGVVAPLAASRNSEIDYLILLAGTGIPGDSILQLQGRLIGEASGMSAEVLDYSDTMRNHLIQIVLEENDLTVMRKKLIEYNRSFLASAPPSIIQSMGLTPTDTTYGIDFFATPWMQYFLLYDPAPVLEKTTIPVLAINGTLDLQVPYQQNLEAIENALRKAGNTQYRIEAMQGLNHLFQTAGTGSPTEYGTIAETIDPEVLMVITAWIKALK